MPTQEQWVKAHAALDDAVLREIIADNPAAAPLIRRRMQRFRRPPPPAMQPGAAALSNLVLITAKPRQP